LFNRAKEFSLGDLFDSEKVLDVIRQWMYIAPHKAECQIVDEKEVL